jgi:hypothetical protein
MTQTDNERDAYAKGLSDALGLIASLGYGRNQDVDEGHEEAFRAVERHLKEWQARAALAQPDPRVAALVEALKVYADSCEATETTPCGYEGNMCCMTARAALAAFDTTTGGKDE